MTAEYMVIFLLALANVVANWACSWLFLRRLQRRHPAAWSELGKPTMIWNNSLANSLAMAAFVYRSRYRVLHDPVLSRLALWMKLLFVPQMILLGLMAAQTLG